MAEPEQIKITEIDEWVKSEGFQQQSTAQMKVLSDGFTTPENQGVPQINWTVYNTNPNGDCMIHSFLMGCSPTFRFLSDQDKEVVAVTFRTTIFFELVNKYYTTPYQIPGEVVPSLKDLANQEITLEQGTIGSEGVFPRNNTPENIGARTAYLSKLIIEDKRNGEKGYLPDTFLYPLCDKYKLHVLIKSEGNELAFRLIPTDDSKEPCIMMYHSGGNHFSGMSCSYDEQANLFIIKNDLANKITTVANLQFETINSSRDKEAPRQKQQGSVNGLPSFSSSSGRSGIDFENYLEESNEPIILSTNLESTDNQLKSDKRETIKNNTDIALAALQKDSEIKLKKLEFFNWFFGGKIPKDCEKLNTPLVKATIKKRIKEFEHSPRDNLLLTLYEGLTGKKFDEKQGDVKMQILALFDSTNESFKEMKELCKLSKLQLILNQAENLKTQAKNFGLLREDGKIVTENSKWNLLLKNMKLADTVGKADKKAKELIKYLDGANSLSALKKAVAYTAKEQNSLLNFKDLPETKWLKEFLTTYRLSGFPIQIALDFNSQDIDDAFVKDATITEKQKEDAEDQNETIINGKTFVKSMVTNMCLPTNFSISDNEFVGNELNQKLVQSHEGSYYVTQKIPFLKEYAEVVLSREIIDTVNYFEQFDINSQNKNVKMNTISLPLYIIFACQKRKRISSKEIAELKLEGDNIYKQDENGNFVYDSFHTSILFLCDGKIYTLGYGSDPFLDDEEKETDPKIKYLKKVEKIVKDNSSFIPGIDLQGVQLLGTGYIYSPDSLNITEDSFNYSIIDIGILKTSHIVRLNKILATIKKVRAISMVIGEGVEPRNITVEQLSAQTMCVYSRLASMYNQYFPIAAQIMNCSSFVEAIFYDRINCTAQLGYSDPNSCVKKQNPYGSKKDKRIEGIFKAYYGDGTLSEFKNLVDYTSDITTEERKIDSLWKKIAKASLIPACIAGTCLLARATGYLGGDAEKKLKNRKKQKRPKNNTARKTNNK